MRQLLVGDPRRARVADGRVRAALEACTDRERDLHEPARLLVERAAVVAPVGQGVERFPDLGVRRSEVADERRNLRAHSLTSRNSVS